MRTNEIATAHDYSARGAARFDTEVSSKDVSCHATPLQCPRAGTPCAVGIGIFWASDAVY
jgi:hypothetical protein